MKNKSFVIAGVLVLVALVGVGISFLTNGNPSVAPSFAAVAGPDSSFPCETHNGVTTCFGKNGMDSATTTPCAIKSPTATSTLHSASAQFRPASTSATVITLAKATSFNATTTKLADCTLAGGAFGTCVASSTSALSVDGVGVFAPNTYFVVGLQGGQGTAAGMAPTGSCQATFEVNS